MIVRSRRPLSDARCVYAHRSSFTDVVGGCTGDAGGDYLRLRLTHRCRLATRVAGL